MLNHTTETLGEHDLEALAALMADNPEFAAKLADAIAEKLGEKLYGRGWNIAGIEEKLDKVLAKLDDHDNRFDRLDTSIADLRAKDDLIDREVRKVNNRLDSIDGHLGINTDTRRTA